MNKTLKKYAAIFLLALLVFPYIQRGRHDFAHDADFHCSTKTVNHLHQLEHHCSICDEVFYISESPKHVFSECNPLFKSIIRLFNNLLLVNLQVV